MEMFLIGVAFVGGVAAGYFGRGGVDKLKAYYKAASDAVTNLSVQ